MHPRFRLPGAAAAVAAVLVCGPVAQRLLAQSFDGLQSAEIERFLTEAPIVRLGETLGGVTRSRQAVLRARRRQPFRGLEDHRREANRRDLARPSRVRNQFPRHVEDRGSGVRARQTDRPENGPGRRGAYLSQHGGGADRVGRSRDVRSRSPEEAAGTAGFRGLEPEYGECPAVRQPDLQRRPALQQHLDHQELGHHPDRPFAIVPAA